MITNLLIVPVVAFSVVQASLMPPLPHIPEPAKRQLQSQPPKTSNCPPPPPPDALPPCRCSDGDGQRAPSRNSPASFYEVKPGPEKCGPDYGKLLDCPIEGQIFKADRCRCECPEPPPVDLDNSTSCSNGASTYYVSFSSPGSYFEKSAECSIAALTCPTSNQVFDTTSCQCQCPTYDEAKSEQCYDAASSTWRQGHISDKTMWFEADASGCLSQNQCAEGEVFRYSECGCSAKSYFLDPKGYFFMKKAEAAAECASFGASLAYMLHDDDLAEANEYLTLISGQLSSLGADVWLGLNYDSETSDWYWEDEAGTLANTTNFDPATKFPVTSHPDAVCTYMNAVDLLWDSIYCSNMAIAYAFCYGVKPTDAGTNMTDNFYFSEVASTVASTAKEDCSVVAENGAPVSITNWEESVAFFTFVYDYYLKNPTESPLWWFGLQYDNSTATWLWDSDGTTLDDSFKSWYPHYTQPYVTPYSSNPCTLTALNMWVNYPCTMPKSVNLSLKAICKKA